MIKEFASPSSYVQGKGVLLKSDPYLKGFGKKPLLLTDDSVYKIVGQKLEGYLKDNGYDVDLVKFNGESSTNEINRITEIGKKDGVSVIYGLGGGKTSDSAKAIADNLGLPVVIMPTLASTDAPCSRLSVIYTDDGSFDHYRFYSHNPNLAVADVKKNVVTSALEKIIEANTLMSGLGFESGGLSGAHAIHDGLTTLEETHSLSHGQKVAYGTLTQLMLEGASQERYDKYFKLILSLGLPTTLDDLHLADASDEELLSAAKAACSENDTISRLPFKVEPDDVAQAFRAVDSYTKDYLATHKCKHACH